MAHELLSGRVVRCWLADGAASEPPFDLADGSLLVAYFSSAEWGCFLRLGWPLPVHVLDLYVEFKLHTNGIQPPYGHGLLGALRYFGLPTIDAEEKATMRALAIRGGPFSEAEKRELIDYCESDVRALDMLLSKMLPHLDMPRALIRGRYMKAVARMEATGIPIDVDLHRQLVSHWGDIKMALIGAAHERYSVFPNGSFSRVLFAEWLAKNDMQWPTTASGQLATDQDAFKSMLRVYPQVAQLQQTLHSLGKLRLNDLAIGADGRNRTLLAPFSARTSRNQPSTTKYVFGLAAWLRDLIRPARGRAIADLDYEQQEFAIAAVLSGDAAMQDAYNSGDAYLAFAKQAGAVPADATKKSHQAKRELYKACVLGVQYGMETVSLARRIEQTPAHARELLEAYRRTYPTYCTWSASAVDFAMLHGYLETVLGWRLLVGRDANPRSLLNAPIQTTGAEVLRLACCFASERGVNVCGPIHDALLIEAAEEEIYDAVATAKQAMTDASMALLGGFAIRVDGGEKDKLIRWPGRYRDGRAAAMWKIVDPVLAKFRP